MHEKGRHNENETMTATRASMRNGGRHVRSVVISIAVGDGWATAAAAQDAADYYKGRTLRVVVGFGPGGGYDLYARLLAKYLPRHLPGNPTVVVENMEGIGSVRAANYVYEA